MCFMLLNIWSDTGPSLSQADLFVVSAKSYLHFAISDINYRCCCSYGSHSSTLEAAFSSHSRSASSPQAHGLQNDWLFPKRTVLPSWPEPWPQMPFHSLFSWLTPTHPSKRSFDITCSRKPSLICHHLTPNLEWVLLCAYTADKIVSEWVWSRSVVADSLQSHGL